MAKGFKSSTVTFKAEMTEQQRVVDGINAKMFDYDGVKRKVSEYRETRKGKPLREAPPNHDDVRDSWKEIIKVMQECRRPYPTIAPVPVVKPPVVFAEFVQVVEDVAPVVKPAPMPEKVQVIDLYPLLLAPPQIAGYLPARTKDNAATTFYAALMAGRAKYQPKVQAGENVSGGVEHKPSYQGAYNNSMHNWSGR
jgi:hypothetical protein